mmetsp:Transcript_20122/g.24886  ORF Transcript_20122/g.24886 Transcript_20122/m.24886 type:complete len:214 (-) Transcript_20122:1507-2148(-)
MRVSPLLRPLLLLHNSNFFRGLVRRDTGGVVCFFPSFQHLGLEVIEFVKHGEGSKDFLIGTILLPLFLCIGCFFNDIAIVTLPIGFDEVRKVRFDKGEFFNAYGAGEVVQFLRFLLHFSLPEVFLLVNLIGVLLGEFSGIHLLQFFRLHCLHVFTHSFEVFLLLAHFKLRLDFEAAFFFAQARFTRQTRFLFFASQGLFLGFDFETVLKFFLS